MRDDNTPVHSVKAIAVSSKRFLDRTTNRTSLLAQRADVTALPHSPPRTNISERDVVLDGLQLELDNYLHEPWVEPFKSVIHSLGSCHVIWCDPLRYWMVCMHPHFDSQFLPVHVGC